MLDRDRDGIITKDDIFSYLEFERGNQKVFPSNVVRAVELYKEPDNGQISLSEFYKMVREVKFLVFPAHRLQDRLRDEMLGTAFWEEILMSLEEKAITEKLELKRKALDVKLGRKKRAPSIRSPQKIGIENFERTPKNEDENNKVYFATEENNNIKIIG